jgi:uncharacterized protein (DUF1501 family)
MQRRHFVRTALGAGAALAATGRLYAAPTGTPRFLLVFLRGGYDAASLLVPSSSAFYREVRPNIAIPQAGPGVVGATVLTPDWALHPALQGSVLPLVLARQACFVPFAGTDDLTRSHFETQDSIELGQAVNGAPSGSRDFSSGFLNRLAGVLQGRDHERESIAFTDQLPLAMRGSADVANLSLKNAPRPADDRLRSAISGMYRGQALQGSVDEAYQVRDEAAHEVAPEMAAPGTTPMAGEMVAANRNAINAKGFEAEARRMARMMRERYVLGFVDVGGWDTHVGQGAATGYLASRLEELGRGLAAYADELGEPAWRNTVVVVLSEFGRTMRENGNRGTDHGHGSVHWVLGGGLASGAPVRGEQQRIEAATLFQNRDWPVLNEYRAMLGGVLARQFALNPAQLQRVFPGVRVSELGLV